MERAAASVDARTAAIVDADALSSACVSEKRFSLRKAGIAVKATPRKGIVRTPAKKVNHAAKAKITYFKNLKKEIPRINTESRKTYRARLVEQLKLRRAVFAVKEKVEGPSVVIPFAPSL
jgi:hypothetical protein